MFSVLDGIDKINDKVHNAFRDLQKLLWLQMPDSVQWTTIEHHVYQKKYFSPVLNILLKYIVTYLTGTHAIKGRKLLVVKIILFSHFLELINFLSFEDTSV